MAQQLNIAKIIETLGGVGSPDERITCEKSAVGWRLRKEGGPVVHIGADGKLSFSGRHSIVMRKKLGLSGRYGKCYTSPEEIEAAGLISCDEGSVDSA